MVPYSTPIISMMNFKSPRNRRTKSVLINNNVFKLFAKWIDKKNDDYTQQNMPYRFERLLRGTKDGFDAAKFHELCDNKGATISLARIKDSKQIIGGYNPLNWYQNGQYADSSDSFLFNTTDSDNLNSAQIGRISGSYGYAVYYDASYGPTFGGGNDLLAQGNSWTANNHTYANISIPNNFIIDEYEVFKVVKLI